MKRIIKRIAKRLLKRNQKRTPVKRRKPVDRWAFAFDDNDPRQPTQFETERFFDTLDFAMFEPGGRDSGRIRR